MKYFINLILLFLSYTAFAKFYPGTIYLKNGVKIEATIEVPKQPTDLYLNYASNNKKSFFKSFEVDVIVVKLKEDNVVVMSYLEIENGSDEGKSNWAILQYSTKAIDVYTTAQNYNIDKNHNLEISTSGLMLNRGLVYYFKKKDLNKLYKIFEYQDGLVDRKSFYENVAFYCKDEPRLVSSVLNKEFTWQDIYKIAEVYNTFKEYRKAKQSQNNTVTSN